VIWLNHLGSSVHTDTGRDAAAFANVLGRRVLAVDRPGSGYSRPGQGVFLGKHYPEAFRRLVRREVAPILHAEGIEGTVVAGRSAGGVGAIVMAAVCRDILSPWGVHAQEPVGWRAVELTQGKKMYEDYGALQDRLLEENPDLERPEPNELVGLEAARRRWTIKLHRLLDYTNSRHAFALPYSLAGALYIARAQPETYLDVRFAETSLAGDPLSIAKVGRLLQQARPDAGGGAPIHVETVPNTVHTSFDRRNFSAGHLAEAVDLAIRYRDPLPPNPDRVSGIYYY